MAHTEIQERMNQLPQVFQAQAAKGLDAVLQFNLTGEKSGEFSLAIKGASCSVTEGEAEGPTTTFTLDGQDWLDLTEGKASGQGLFMQGKLKVDGNMGVAMKMPVLFKFGA